MAIPAKKKPVQTATKNDDFIVLDGPEKIRRNVGMYVGGSGEDGLFKILCEVIDNASDEAKLGRCSHIRVSMRNLKSGKQEFTVADNGNGIPVDMYKDNGKLTKTSILTHAFTTIHAGNKFAGHTSKQLMGTHGVGVTATNALSSSLIVYTNRLGVWYMQSFEKGVPVTDVTTLKNRDVVSPYIVNSRKGTLVQFLPDYTVFSTKPKVSIDKLGDYLDLRSHLCPGVTIDLNIYEGTSDDPDEAYTYKSNGLSQYVQSLLANSDDVAAVTPIIKIDTPEVQASLVWLNTTSLPLHSFVNGIRTEDGGTHVNGLRKAIVDSLSSYGQVSTAAITVSLSGAFAFNINGPQYTSQTKNKLASPEATDLVYNAVVQKLKEFWSKNKKAADTIIKVAKDIENINSRAKLASEAAASLKSLAKRGSVTLADKFHDTVGSSKQPKELFIVEGDSAAGPVKTARDPSYQAVLPLTGKPPNMAASGLDKCGNNQAIKLILMALGYNPDKPEESRSRFDKIILMNDPDPDGKHISILLIGIIAVTMPYLLEEKRVYIVDDALFTTIYKDERIFAKTRDMVLAKIKAANPKISPEALKKIVVTRLKGWGETDKDNIEYLAINPNTRLLKQLTVSDEGFEKDLLYALQLITSAQERKETLINQGILS